jgi:hypothetical protein
VDAKTCKVIVLDQRIESMIEFKQTIGRGTRIHEDTGKLWFTIMDFKKVTELFADPEWDGEPVVIYEPGSGDSPVPPEPPTKEGPPIPSDLPEGTIKYVVSGVEVSVLAERVQYYDKDGKLITESLIDFTKHAVASSTEASLTSADGPGPTASRSSSTNYASGRAAGGCHTGSRGHRPSTSSAIVYDQSRSPGSEAPERVGSAMCHEVRRAGPCGAERAARQVRLRGLARPGHSRSARAAASDLGTVQLVEHFGGKSGYLTAVRELETALYSSVA